MVLASASKIRSQMLENAGVSHVSDAANLDEGKLKDELNKEGVDVETTALTLAQAKATAVAGRHPEALVIAADQILECDGRWFEKPESPEAALKTLKALRGKTHQLVNAVSARLRGEDAWQHLGTARLTMRPLSDSFIETYIKEEGPDILDSVGAYRLEQTGAQLFTRVEGDYFTVLGLPLLPLLEFLRSLEILDE